MFKPIDIDSLTLTWKDINAWTKPTIKVKTKIQLLNNVCGIAKSGSLLAIISPNGAGKTTLLAILNGRYKGILKGEIRLNGCLTTSQQISLDSGFVCQNLHIFEEMTLKEHLELKARLKMNPKTTDQERKATISKIVENLSLSHRMQVKISALSGGQRKRLALAVQLLTKPKILFCDEPTTGLDSYNAMRVAKQLRLLADQGKMIICSIHQPTSDIFQMFDEVSLLASGGTLAYHGPVSNIYDHFERLGLKCPPNYNLSEFIITQVTIKPPSISGSQNDNEKVNKIVEFFNSSNECKMLAHTLNLLSSTTEGMYIHHSSRTKNSPIPFCIEFPRILQRTAVLIQRSSKIWILRFLLYIVVMSCIGFPYGIIKIDQTAVQNIQGLLNCLMMEMIYCSLYGAMLSFSEEMPIFLQECADRSCSPLSYYSSKLIILSFKSALEAFIYANLVYGVTGLNRTILDCLLCARPIILTSLVASAYGIFLSTAFDSVTTSSLFSVSFELICSIFAGIVIRLKSLPWYTSWLKYISFTYYAYEALSIGQWQKYNHIECDKKDISECYLNGDQVLALFGFDSNNIYLDYAGLIIFFIVFHLLGFFFLKRRIKTSIAY